MGAEGNETAKQPPIKTEKAGGVDRVGIEEYLELMNDYATQAAMLRDALEALEVLRIREMPGGGPCWCQVKPDHTLGCQLARGVLERAEKLGVRK